ncbi:hypothetical protein K501DRAFT_158516, partial [Backusella circina FSU 941]
RNIWFRLIHNKIASPVILHQFNPSDNPSAVCFRCNGEQADAAHFLITCPV